MSTNFPTSVDDGTTLPNPSGANTLDSPDHASIHANGNDAIKAVEAKVGTGSSTPANNTFLIGNGTGTSAWSSVTSAQLASRISDETGTGSAVFATTPTLVTPKVDTINESTPANGVTVDGLNIKDGALNTNNSVVTANITDAAVTTAKIANAAVTSTKVTFDGAQAYRNSAQVIPNITATTILFDNENFDTNSYHNNSTNTTRMTVPSAGYYLCSAGVEFAASANGQRNVWLSRNGSSTERFGEQEMNSTVGTNPIVLRATDVIYMSAAGYIEVFVYQSSGGNLNVYIGDTFATQFTITRLGS